MYDLFYYLSEKIKKQKGYCSENTNQKTDKILADQNKTFSSVKKCSKRKHADSWWWIHELAFSEADPAPHAGTIALSKAKVRIKSKHEQAEKNTKNKKLPIQHRTCTKMACWDSMTDSLTEYWLCTQASQGDAGDQHIGTKSVAPPSSPLLPVALHI